MRKCKTLINYFRLKSDVITILKLRTDLIEKAVKLKKIKEDTNISKQDVNIAFNLYEELQKINEPKKFKFYPFNEKEASEFSLADFSEDAKKIISLRNWVLEVLPIIDLYNQVGKLPLTRENEDFIEYLKDCFNTYISGLENICSATLETVITKKDLRHAKNLCEGIIYSLQEYYKGFPSKASNGFYRVLKNNVSKPNHFNDIKTLQNFDNEFLYKMRVGTDHVFTSKEMFHIPLELRGIVSTNRYSIPGLPCIYLGSSPLTCWEELNKPDLNTVQTSVFKSDDISYIDLSTPPVVFIEKIIKKFYDHGTIMKKRFLADRLNEPNEVISYLIIWPLMAACSVRVKNTTNTFKPEYIIPQLLLQFIRYDGFFDGVSYFSTKVDNYSAETAVLYKNFAFPVQDGATKGLCSKLQSKFDVSDAVPWKMYKDSDHCLPNEGEKRVEHEFIDGMSLLYSSTDFSKLETFLQNKFLLERSN
ncbi:hypothetical protein IEK_05604 [Bacillus toyonensis]|uniref:hypothetical protein n=1 Tax=Bacillus toyonensis TaxID=155322 RepID=UPI00027BECDC|nr:hypothetical protein [Bacillus toyonensis]EJV42769.1 hypothetical protein IEK_05604 [Bacillus toyonensis]PED95456.1 hypothetical protein CON78_29035 [Bacillus toyonensis]PEE20644.1 hypothetical protein CON95_27800 [Bacillus toyonensis]PFX81952.1 hypothetical protein COL40_26730 [Bacillus toyonensis]PHC19379.1 hypothetical protein COE97_01045 [Bacillus toyonensis]